MTTNSDRLSLEEEADMSRRLQICLGLATKELYTIITADRVLLSNRAETDPAVILRAEERRRIYAVGNHHGESLMRRLNAMSKKVDYGFRILKQFGPTDGGDIADRFVEANQGFLGIVASRYGNAGYLAREELMQVGQIGLCHATLRFDPQAGKFATFAFWCIKSFIGRALTETGRLIRLPVATVRQIVRIDKSRRQFLQEHGKMPNIDELAEAVQIPHSRLLEILPHMVRPSSLDVRVYLHQNSNEASCEVEKPSEALSPMEAVTERRLTSVLESQLARLAKMERDIVVCQLDLHGDGYQSFQTLGQRYGFSHEGIRKMYRRAIAKLREWLGPDFCLD